MHRDLVDHAAFVRGLTGHLVRDPATADDVAQDTLALALAQPPREVSALRAFLARTARRLVSRRRRETARRARREGAVARPERERDTGPGLARGGADGAKAHVLGEVTDAVLALAEPYRATVLAHYYEGRSPAALAAAEGVPIDTVHSRLRRARMQIRARLDQRTPGGRAAWSGAAISLAAGTRAGPALPHATSAVPASVAGAGALRGMLWMSTKTKSAAVCAVVALALFSLWMLGDGGAPPVVDGPATVRAADVDALEVDGAEVVPAAADAADARVSVAAEAAVEPSQAAPARVLIVDVVWEVDGAPAIDRGFDLYFWDDAEPFRSGRTARTDAEGRMRFERVPAGRAALYGHVAGGGGIEVADAGETHVQIVLEPGSAIAGRVLDQFDQPVVDASLWLSDYGNSEQGRIVVRSDSLGRFSIRGVGPGRELAAVAPDCAPGRMLTLDAMTAAERAALTVRLDRGRAATVAGVVLDPAGRPVADAMVRLEAHVDPAALVDDRGKPVARETRTDAEGRYVVEGLAPGLARLMVRGPQRFGPVERQLELRAGERADGTVRLTAGVTLRGSVTDGGGRIVGGAEVQIGPYAGFLSRFVKVDAVGEFVIEGLSAGETTAKVEKEGVGRADRTFVAAPGDEVAWAVRLDAGLEFRGRVVDDAGEPRAGWSVWAVSRAHVGDTRTLWSRGAKTDGEGRFTLVSVPDAALRCEFTPPGRRRAVFTERDLRPGRPERVITISDAELAEGVVRGRLVLPDGRPAVGVSVRMASRRVVGSRKDETDAEGKFVLREVGRGGQVLYVESPELPRQTVARFEMKPAEERDLGVLTTLAGGMLVVTTQGAAGLEAPFTTLTLQHVEGMRREYPVRFGRGEADGEQRLLPGKYEWMADGEGLVRARGELVVEAGERCALDLTPVPGQPCDLVLKVVAAGGGDGEPAPFAVRVRDAEGQGVASWMTLDQGAAGVRTRRWLVPGEYTLEAEELQSQGSAGHALRQAERTFSVGPAGAGDPVEIEVRPR